MQPAPPAAFPICEKNPPCPVLCSLEGEIPSSGISPPERRGRSPFSQGEASLEAPLPERERPLTALLSPGEACVQHAPTKRRCAGAASSVSIPPEPLVPSGSQVPQWPNAQKPVYSDPLLAQGALPYTAVYRFQQACTEYSIAIGY